MLRNPVLDLLGRLVSATTRGKSNRRAASGGSSDRVLVMLTNEYPTTEVGEAFITNELPFIKDPFCEVIFAPRFRSAAEPMNVEGSGLQLPFRVLIPELPTRVRLLRSAGRSLLSPTVLKAILVASPQEDVSSRPKTVLSAAKRVMALEERVDSIGRSLRQELAGRQPTFYSYWFHSSAYVAQRLAKQFDSYAVTRAHRYDIYPSASWDSAWHFASIAGLSAVFSCSSDGRSYLQSKLPHSATKIEASHLGTQDYGTQESPRIQGQFHLVTVSRVTAVKRLDRIARALSIHHGGGPMIRWTHFGGGKKEIEDDAFASQVRAVLPTHVTFDFRGSVPNRDIVSHYRTDRVDLFANVSESEGIPVSIMEALSFGIPVAATPVGGTPELVQDTYNGFLLSLDAVPDSLAAVIGTVANMEDRELEELRSRARASWEAAFRAETNYPDFYEQVLHHGMRGRS